MHIHHLSLTNFRNYARLELTIPTGMTLLYGDNAQGKTSLLEAIYYLATSRSLHTTSDRQLINWMAEDEPMPYARLVCEAQAKDGVKRIEMTLMNERKGLSTRFKKQVRVNGRPRRVMDLLGQIRVVMFLPQDLALVEGSPSERRRYLDITLCQTDREYCRALSQYNKVLTQRNALLKQFQERGGRGDMSQLDFWDDKLVTTGSVIVAGRFRLVRELERAAQIIHRDLSGANEHLRLRYQPGFDATPSPEGQMSFAAADLGPSALPQLEPDEIARRFKEALDGCRRDDIKRGQTTIGPQRDEMRFLVNRHDLGLYGSRGQNRTAVLAVKLGELQWMQEKTNDWPILLLDEVVAELDIHRRGYLLERVNGAEQVLLTTTEPYLLPDQYVKQATKWQVTGGHISTEVGE